MKTIYCTFIMLTIVSQVCSAEPVSIEDFKKITDMTQRSKIIQQAPSEQKEALKKIDLHLHLLADFGDEQGLKTARETQVARARGFIFLPLVFSEQCNIFGRYMGSVLDADQKAGMKIEQLQPVALKLKGEEDALRQRYDTVHSLVFMLAATPTAMELEARAKALSLTIDERQPYQSETYRLNFFKESDQIFEELKQLPKLTPAQAQKEFDAFTDDKVRPR